MAEIIFKDESFQIVGACFEVYHVSTGRREKKKTGNHE